MIQQYRVKVFSHSFTSLNSSNQHIRYYPSGRPPSSSLQPFPHNYLQLSLFDSVQQLRHTNSSTQGNFVFFYHHAYRLEQRESVPTSSGRYGGGAGYESEFDLFFTFVLFLLNFFRIYFSECVINNCLFQLLCIFFKA